MPNVEVKETTTKGSYTLPTEKIKTKKIKEPKVKTKKVKEPKVKIEKVKEPKVKTEKVKEPKVETEKVKEPKVETEKKPGLFSNIFRHSERKSKAPALDLPAVERDLTPTNELREPHRHDSDPLRIPNTDLPKPDLPLPTYDRPEVDMSTGQTKQSSEFSIPVVDLPPIPNLHLPENEKQTIDSNIDPMKVPNVNLPELQFTSNELETTKLPEIHIKSEKDEQQITKKIEEKLPELPLITDIKQEKEVEHLPIIETDYEIKTDSTIPDLPKLSSDETEIPIKPELLSTEKKIFNY